MYDFTFHRPETLDEAAKIFANADDGQFIAGGQTIVPVMKQRLAMPSDLIDLNEIPDIRGITVADGIVHVGATTRHADVAASDDIKVAIPALANLAGLIGDP